MSRLIFSATALLVAASFAVAAEDYTLVVKNDRVSLRAANGSLVEVVEELGSLLDFEVIANLRDDVRVDLDFEDLEVSEAIRRICAPVGYVESPDPESGRIMRLVLVSGGKNPNRAEARRDPLPARPAPVIPAVNPDPESTPVRKKDQADEATEQAQKAAREDARKAREAARTGNRDGASRDRNRDD